MICIQDSVERTSRILLTDLRTYNASVYLSSIRDFTLATRSFSISWKMAGFDTNLNYGTFDPDMDPASVGSRFRKYVERFKVYALAMNIKDKARKRAFIFTLCRTKSTRYF